MSIEERFWSRVDKRGADECWVWRGNTNGRGYGVITFGGRRIGTHRLSWIFAHGPIPDGLCVMHKCDNRPCVNPNHIILGTLSENTKDMWRKGRQSKGHKFPPRHGELCGHAKLTTERVREIRARPDLGDVYFADQYGVSTSTIRAVRTGQNWAHIK